MSMSHGVNKKAHTIVSPNPPPPPPHPPPPPIPPSPYQVFTRLVVLQVIVYQPFFCSDLTDYCKNKAFPK